MNKRKKKLANPKRSNNLPSLGQKGKKTCQCKDPGNTIGQMPKENFRTGASTPVKTSNVDQKKNGYRGRRGTKSSPGNVFKPSTEKKKKQKTRKKKKKPDKKGKGGQEPPF